jgi:hypothetical protein
MSSSVRFGITASAWSIALSTAFCSLSSSTTTNSMLIEVWKRISSSACRLVGSATARNRRLPRFISGITRCFCSSLSLTEPNASMSGTIASMSSSGTPNSFEAEIAISRAVATLLATRWVTRLMRFSLAFASCMASCMGAASSSQMPSCATPKTRRCARPPIRGAIQRDSVPLSDAALRCRVAARPKDPLLIHRGTLRNVFPRNSPGRDRCAHIGRCGRLVGRCASPVDIARQASRERSLIDVGA